MSGNYALGVLCQADMCCGQFKNCIKYESDLIPKTNFKSYVCNPVR